MLTEFYYDHCVIKDKATIIALLVAALRDGLYQLDLSQMSIFLKLSFKLSCQLSPEISSIYVIEVFQFCLVTKLKNVSSVGIESLHYVLKLNHVL